MELVSTRQKVPKSASSARLATLAATHRVLLFQTT